jgi:hypothetical protein
MALNINLEVDEVNTILRVLGKHPFDEVVALVSKIKQQGDAQLAEQAAVKEADPAHDGQKEEAPAAE